MMNHALRRQPALVFLAAGALLGLILGLLIGWVFWPVEWTGATLRDLNPAEKAEYIAAVADAFAIYDSPEAAAVAQRRLAPLDDGNLTQTFQEALGYFAATQIPDRAIRDSNIRRLAVALNLSPGGAPPQELAGVEAAATATNVPQVVTAPPTTADDGGGGWVGWLLWLLTALLLLGGGIYILNRTGLPDLQQLFPRRKPTPDAVDEFDEPAFDPTARGQRGAKTMVTADPDGDYPFAQEMDDELSPPMRSPTDHTYRRPPTRVYDADKPLEEEDYAPAPRGQRDLIDDDFLEEDDGDDEFVDEQDDSLAQAPFDEDDDDQAGPWRPGRSSYTIDVANEGNAAPPTDVSRPAPPPVSPEEGRAPERRPPVDRDPPPSNSTQPTAALTSAAVAPTRQAAPRTGSQRAAAPSIRPRATVIDQHIFHYQMGMAEYDESRPIVDPQSGKYIGEFGMGASSKNALAQVGPDQLVALEVWLFDKSDERNLGNQTRILLSEYAVDHNLEQMFLKERNDNPRPFTAQRGVHFQLESQNLLLDCTIVDVTYSTANATKGIFQQITVDMTVQKK